MIIRELGIVVGKIDDETFKVTDSTSDKLTALITNWVTNGISILTGQEEPLAKGQASGDVFVQIKSDNEFFIDVLHTQLLIAGFDVQTA